MKWFKDPTKILGKEETTIFCEHDNGATTAVCSISPGAYSLKSTPLVLSAPDMFAMLKEVQDHFSTYDLEELSPEEQGLLAMVNITIDKAKGQ